jgi:peptidoglycan hydrolase-like protein with peptidoglycan-binding domain
LTNNQKIELNTNYFFIGQKSQLPAEATVAGKAVTPTPKAEFLTGVDFRLDALGFASGPVDGIIEPLTRDVTMRFQRAYPPLRVDGSPGLRTQFALVSVCSY